MSRYPFPSLLLACSVCLIQPASGTTTPDQVSPNGSELAWPPIANTAKPWAYWHWMGSAVDETNLVRELQRYADVGLGGMHVIPIYGARGWEDRYIQYLTPRWMEALRLTVTEARRLGMDIDMTTGTGWNFGGPDISAELSCWRVQTKLVDIQQGQEPAPIADHKSLLALLAESSDGQVTDLTERINADGRVDWKPADAGSRLRIVTFKAGQPAVKRAAPGGEGPMLNPFHRPSVDRYLKKFTDAFAAYDGPKPRAQYHDSYEYSGAAWTPDLLDEFAKRRGYRIESHRAALFGTATNDIACRVRCDFRETLSDLLLDSMTEPWANWSRRHGFVTRNQAHGSPANLLDLYAAADIPETEMFNKDRDILVSKFASSAAHVAGHPLVAAETGTWVAEHFTETLADLKRNVDDLFLAGANHIFYHGTCYSPDEAGWPGWLFYAAAQINPRNPIWRDMPTLNSYVARAQSVLQAGHPDNDLLVYWPIHDLWHDQRPLVEQLTVHHRHWLDAQPIGQITKSLWRRGYAFDLLSDRQLASARVATGRIALPGAAYQAVVVPRCRHVPLATFQRLLALAQEGATVIFDSALPDDVPGLDGLDKRRHTLKSARANIQFTSTPDASLSEAKHGLGRIMVGNVSAALRHAGARREALVDQGVLAFLRRAHNLGTDYFLLNSSTNFYEGWVPLRCKAKSVGLMNPMTGQAGWAVSRPASNDVTEVFVQLHPYESIVARASNRIPTENQHWVYANGMLSSAVELRGNWRVEFIEGGPELPSPLTTDKLTSWTELGGEHAKRFAGTARYTITFDRPRDGQTFLLDLGHVAQSARVRLNKRDIGTLIMSPFRLLLEDLKPTANMLEIEVTSTAANRIRDLDVRKANWKSFHDINFVNIAYKPFDASQWPLHPAGLLDPVRLGVTSKHWTF